MIYRVDGRSGRERLLLPTLVLMSTLTALVSSLGAPLVPTIAAEEGVSLAAAQWALTATLLTGAVLTPVLGRLGGSRHRRTVLLGAMGVVGVGLLVAALPTGYAGLLTGRALQGVGMGLAPLAMAVARDHIPQPRLHSAMAYLSVSVVAGAGLGYPVTAFVADRFGLSAAYWLGFGVTALTLLLAVWVLPGSVSDAVTPVDWPGAALLAVGTSALLLAMSRAEAWGAGAAAVASVGVVVLGLWVRRSLRTAYPLVDLRLASRRGVAGANVAAVTAGVGIYMLLSMMMVLSQAPRETGYGLEMSVTAAGALLVPYSLASVLGSRLTVSLARVIQQDLLLPLGSAIYLVATLGMAVWLDEPWQLFVWLLVAGLGGGCTFAAMPGLLVRFVPAEETGSAMAFNQVLRYLGFSTGSALTPTLLHAFSGGDELTPGAFTAVLLVVSGVWVVTGVGTYALARTVRR